MVMGEAFRLETLLPPDARLVDPTDPDQRIQPEYDDRGLLNIEKLTQDVIATVDPAYQWSNELNIHHFYWPAVSYPHIKNGAVYENPALFRNLPIHRGLMPRAFHAWLHIVAEPPLMPDPEVIRYRNEAWAIAKDLFKTARQTIITEKLARRRRLYVANNPDTLRQEFNGEDQVGIEAMQQLLERNFRGFERHMVRQEALPKEHRIFDLDGSPKKIATELGRIVVPRSLYFGNELQVA